MPALSASDLFKHTKILALDALPTTDLVTFCTSQPERASDAYASALWTLRSDAQYCQVNRLTHEGSVSSPRISPDGTLIAFLSQRHGAQRPVPYLIHPEGGEAWPVPHLDSLQVAQLLQWSSDGRQLLALVSLPYAEDSRDDVDHPARPHVIRHAPFKLDGSGYTVGCRRHLFELSIDGSTPPVPLTSGDHDVTTGAWSPDGRRLAYVARGNGAQRHRSNLWVVDDRKAPQPVTEHMATVIGPVWSNAGARLAFAGNTVEGDSASYLHVWDSDQTITGPLGPHPLETGQIIWAPDDERLAAVASHQGLFPLLDIKVDGSDPVLRDLGDVQLSLLAVSSAGPVCVSSTWCALDEVHLLSWQPARPSCCSTVLNAALTQQLRMHCVRERFDVPDGDGGSETVDVWVFSPWGRQEKQLPLLLDMHGGPHSVALMDFASHVYLYAMVARGWRVIAPNTVGSSGYGESFARRLRGRWGALDFPQMQAIVGALRQDGRAGQLVACAGKSYGGFLSAWAIANDPGFSAAVISAPVANMASHAGTSDSGYYVAPYAMGGETDEVRERYDALSPVEYFGKVSQPVLLLNGDQDQRCPIGQAEELFTRMLRLGCPRAAMVIYPGGSHGMAGSGRPSHRLDYHERIVEFLVESERQARARNSGKEGG
ncbi:hypothetical protein C1922_10210 [Stenotrophomonas sp. ZAC14D2_NAIMI4_7]|uniref:alpha/beta hydrolase family protein n=1 Tax=Stenotrophomonas sp. ZAC14D2_NAIMI4_7 TaxID=2072405 RepID=UPI000D54089D|nr:prolyl oligopeptidase family serine peptidase [Stenotrophomonas sp. ZAC14D2_NAIMI4_7]AWH17650.1 hypothetical protein C1922_10210 [Stenotrophomonas sp. ZAC14D2_NAIMI4_7]